MIVGPSIPCPIPNMLGGTSYFASSWLKITFWIADAPRPPNSTGQVMQAHFASAFVACHCFARDSTPTSFASASSSPARCLPGALSTAFVSSQARASARKAASSGVSLKSMSGLQSIDQAVAPLAGRTEREREQLRAPVEEMAVVLPREADAAVHLDDVLASQVERLARRDPRAARGHRQLGGPGRERPRAVVGVGRGELDRGVDVGEAVFDRLERRDRPAERIAVQRELARHLECALGAADLLEGREHGRAVEQIQDRRLVSAVREHLGARAVEGDPARGRRRVDRPHRRHLDARAIELDQREYWPGIALRHDDREPRDLSVGYRELHARELAARQSRGDRADGAAPGALAVRERADQLAGGETRQVLPLLLFAAELEHRLGREIDAGSE